MYTKIHELVRNKTQNKSIIGIGTGRTVEGFIKYLDKEKTYVASSYQTMISLNKYGLKTMPVALVESLEVYIDGVDYFDNLGNLIKGKGGALTTEKIMCSMADEVIILAQDFKFRETFNECFVPIEIIPQSLNYLKSILKKAGEVFSLRTGRGKHGPLITENGNFILDLKFNPNILKKIRTLCGVIEHGYFDSSDYNITLEIFNKNLAPIN